MCNRRGTRLLEKIEKIKRVTDEKTLTKCDIHKLGRINEKLSIFETDCKLCNRYLNELNEQITRLADQHAPIQKVHFKALMKRLDTIALHLQNQHKLIQTGFYLGLWMSIGTSVGLIVAALLFYNIGIGIALGICIGSVVGALLEAHSKKKGITI